MMDKPIPMPKQIHMQQPTKSFLSLYKEPEDFRDQQLKIFWPHYEIKVEKDVHDILTNFTDAEKHGVFTTLKLFTHYEAKAGEEYWTGRFMRMFPRHEFTSMAAIFGATELCSHAPFYNKINVLLNAHDDTFYTDYIDNDVLRARMASINHIINHPNDLVSLAGFSLVEGVILYSSFAFLKHFQSLGKNKLVNVVSGIDFSVRDENLHAMAGAWCFKELLRQSKEIQYDVESVYPFIYDIANLLYEHECAIIDMIFEKGEIEGVTSDQLKLFVMHRLDLCLTNLGITTMFDTGYNPIGEWFYKGINNYKMNDFFNRQGREYIRGWQEKSFLWNPAGTKY